MIIELVKTCNFYIPIQGFGRLLHIGCVSYLHSRRTPQDVVLARGKNNMTVIKLIGRLRDREAINDLLSRSDRELGDIGLRRVDVERAVRGGRPDHA